MKKRGFTPKVIKMPGSTNNTELVNPFVFASFSVMSMLFGEAPQKGATEPLIGACSGHEVAVVMGITGGARGHVILGLSTDTAKNVASAMMGQTVDEFDQLAVSAVAELGNILCGNGLLQLNEEIPNCDLTPPTILNGDSIDISALASGAVLIPLKLTFGVIDLVVGLKVASSAAAA